MTEPTVAMSIDTADGVPPSTNGATSPASSELARLQARVASHPQEFESWTALVTEAEKVKDATIISQVTNGLLEHFPLCFGYWQRLAKHEANVAATAAGLPAAIHADVATIERGLVAIPHSHELWTFYGTELMKNEQIPPEEVRSVFQRGAAVISTDSGASAFWDKYLEFELVQFASPAVQAQLQLLPPPYTGTIIGGVYAQILTLPLRDLEKFWVSYSQKFAVNYPLNYLASPEEAAEYTANYPKEIPEERKIYTAADGTQQPMTLTQYLNEWELEQRRLLLQKREYTFRVSLALRDEKYLFEAAITRPYFHVAPLSPPELANWNSFLDFMESKLMKNYLVAHPPQPGQTPAPITMDQLDPLLLKDTLKLYERCVIPCAGYYEFWDRYSCFLDSLNETQRALDVRQRALVFMQRNVVSGQSATPVQECLVGLAELSERLGRVEEARQFYQQAVTIPPASAAAATTTTTSPPGTSDSTTPLLEAIVAQIQFERRQLLAPQPNTQFFDASSPLIQLYQQALDRLHPSHSIQNTKSFIYLTLHYIHFTLTQVAFTKEEERLQEVRTLYQTAAELLFPKPVTTTTETPVTAATAADAAPGVTTTTVSNTTVPRLVASKQFLIFWLSFIEFETTVARSPTATIVEIYERALQFKTEYPASVVQSNPHVLIGGASGLSDASKKQLWASYVAFMEERAASAQAIEKVKQAAKQALNSLISQTSSTPLLSVLGKRKQTTTPLEDKTTIKQARPAPPVAAAAPPQRYGGYGAPPPTSGYGAYGAGGYGAPPPTAYPAQGGYGAPPPVTDYYGGGGGGGYYQ